MNKVRTTTEYCIKVGTLFSEIHAKNKQMVGALHFILSCIWINCVTKENYSLLFDFVQRCKVGRKMFAEKLKPFAHIHTIQKEENENRAQSCGGINKQAVLHCSAKYHVRLNYIYVKYEQRSRSELVTFAMDFCLDHDPLTLHQL